MEFRILGLLDVREGGRALALGGPKQRALLAVLLLHANETVSSGRLIDQLWGDQPPESATKALHFYVSQLRRVLEPDRPVGTPGRLLLTHGSGYELRTDPEQIDLHRFERLLLDAQAAREAGDHSTASNALRQALGLWRGPPLADLASQPFAPTAITRIEELRLSALEEWCEEELVLGRHARLIGESERLVAEYPLRERFRGQLMLALYRSGRQAEALDTYRQARHVLVEELGIEPSPQLQRLERAILVQDPTLELPPKATGNGAAAIEVTHAAPPAADRRSTRRKPARAAAAALALGALVAGGLLALTKDDAGARRSGLDGSAPSAVGEPRLVPSSIVAIDPETNVATSVVQLGVGTQVKAVGEGAVWVANTATRTVSSIDLTTRKVVDTIGLPVIPDAIAAGEGGVWVASREGPLLRIHPQANLTESWDVLEKQGALQLPAGTVIDGSIAVGHRSLWLGISNVLTLWRTDARTGRITATVKGLDPRAMAASPDALWVLDAAGRISRLDPNTNNVIAAVRFGTPASSPGGLAIGEGAVWVLDTEAGHLVRIDPTLNQVVTTIPLDLTPIDAVTTGEGSVWVTQQTRGAVLRIDAATNRVRDTIRLGHSIELGTIRYGGGSIWVAIGEPLGH
jgi:DNA-binding SARP family transcriptional activator/streptogramin lyase